MGIYTPPPTIKRFMLDNSRRRVVMGPVGAGKTVGCCPIEILRRAAMQAPDQSGMRRTRWAVVRNTARQLQDTTIKTFLDWVPNGQAGIYRVVDKTFIAQFGDVHAEIMFRALDDAADKKNLLSLELTGAFFNEARDINREIVELMDTRIGRYPRKDNGGPTWHGMWADTNPPNEGEYWYHVIENEHPDPPHGPDMAWKVFLQPDGLSPEAENVENLPANYYANFCEGKSEEFINVYVRNKYGRLRHGKPVHALFKRERHVAKSPILLNPHLPVLLAFDFGRTPAVTFSQLDAFGRMLVLDEITTEGMSLQTCLDQRVRPIIRNRFPNVALRATGDPSGGWGVQTDEQTCKTILQKFGFRGVNFPASNKSDFRQEALDDFLQRETLVGPAFLVDPRCKNLIRALEGAYHFLEDRKGGMREEVCKDHPWSDIAESCEYAAIHWGGNDHKVEWHRRMERIRQQVRSNAGAYTTRVA